MGDEQQLILAAGVFTLVENEAIIARGLTTFVEVGSALARIRDERQYREAGYTEFDTYCRERWEMSETYATRHIQAAEVVQALPIGNGPASESQARELVSTLREEGADAVAAVLEEAAARGPLTARSIAEVVAERKPATAADEPKSIDIFHLQAGTNTSWYTQPRLIEAARRTMGSIELDPSSCAEANQIVRAERFHTEETDGLTQPWKAATVWMNPPFGRSVVPFIEKLLQAYVSGDVGQAVLLTAARTDARWFHLLLDYPILLMRGRNCYYGPGGVPSEEAFGSCITYLGNRPDAFAREFGPFGVVMERRAFADGVRA